MRDVKKSFLNVDGEKKSNNKRHAIKIYYCHFSILEFQLFTSIFSHSRSQASETKKALFRFTLGFVNCQTSRRWKIKHWNFSPGLSRLGRLEFWLEPRHGQLNLRTNIWQAFKPWIKDAWAQNTKQINLRDWQIPSLKTPVKALKPLNNYFWRLRPNLKSKLYIFYSCKTFQIKFLVDSSQGIDSLESIIIDHNSII